MKKIKQWTLDWWLIGILVLAAFLYSWNIWEAGNANDYYTAAITSMIQSWHNFWYGAFDPAGFITVDKPPDSALVHGHFLPKFSAFTAGQLFYPQFCLASAAWR